MSKHVMSVKNRGGATVEATAGWMDGGSSDGVVVCGGCQKTAKFRLVTKYDPEGSYLNTSRMEDWADAHASACSAPPRR